MNANVHVIEVAAGSRTSFRPACQEPRTNSVLLRRAQSLTPSAGRGDVWFRVRTGALRNCRPLADGRRQITAFVLPGEWGAFGGASASGASIEAILRAEVERFSTRDMQNGRWSDGCAPDPMRAILDAQLAAAQRRLLVLGHMTAREKLASFVLEMSARLGDGGDTVALPMSRYDIADYLCLSSETVCRNFTQLAADGLIALPVPQRVQILRRGALEFIGAR